MKERRSKWGSIYSKIFYVAKLKGKSVSKSRNCLKDPILRERDYFKAKISCLPLRGESIDLAYSRGEIGGK